MRGRSESVGRTVAIFTLLWLLVLAVVSAAGYLVIRRIATEQAVEEARQLTSVAARVVERRIGKGFLEGDAVDTATVERLVRESVLFDPIVRVKLWGPDGTVLLSDEPRQIGERHDDAAARLRGLGTDEVVAQVADLADQENELDRDLGELLQVYTMVEDPKARPLLFETYQLASSIDRAQEELLAGFAPVLIVALLAFGLLMLPLAWTLARRLQRAGQDRERLLLRTLDTEDQERRRIAGDLHDGPVQDLAGLSMRLAAEAEAADDQVQRRSLEEAAGGVRASVRTLRSAIVGIYPPNLEAAGLGPALSDLTARLPREGLEVSMDVSTPHGFGLTVDRLLYRVCQEALRNVERHAQASRVSIRVLREGPRAVLIVEDDGRGVQGDEASGGGPEENGHLGLQILRDVVQDGGGQLFIGPGPSRGTVVRVEVPIS